ncbi:MAG: hypothetical protein JXQ82_03175 [Methanomicrobiaceae archaeon]|nr:hypothetical protein [Methanomicrobiaceae archaeon]
MPVFFDDDGLACPVCGNDCIKDAEEVISSLDTVFSRCPSCIKTFTDRNKPPSPDIKEPCPECKKRFIDDVIAHCYLIMAQAGEIPLDLPLAKTGIPLVDPGFAMKSPPYLPENSLVLITPYAGYDSAKRIVKEVPEVKGVVKDNGIVPGVLFSGEGDGIIPPKSVTNTLLAGCDVRCDVFYAGNVPFVTYKSQSEMHIEFPRGFDPKIRSVETNVRRHLPDTFVDACSGSGTLGISAALFGVNSVVFNDIWYPAVFWTMAGIYSNRKMLEVERSEIFLGYEELKELQGNKIPVKAGHFEGRYCSYDVYLGDYRELPSVVGGEGILAALDIFEKKDRALVDTVISDWKIKVGGDAFIP